MTIESADYQLSIFADVMKNKFHIAYTITICNRPCLLAALERRKINLKTFLNNLQITSAFCLPISQHNINDIFFLTPEYRTSDTQMLLIDVHIDI
jgi:hypothetical protein